MTFKNPEINPVTGTHINIFRTPNRKRWSLECDAHGARCESDKLVQQDLHSLVRSPWVWCAVCAQIEKVRHKVHRTTLSVYTVTCERCGTRSRHYRAIAEVLLDLPAEYIMHEGTLLCFHCYNIDTSP